MASRYAPGVSLCMIVRNEAGQLRDCLRGISALFDEIVVVDTGSSDGTQTIARELGARVYDFPWCEDFSAARNEALKHAAGEWIFWLDADDRILPSQAESLRDLFHSLGEKNQAYVMATHCTQGPPDALVTIFRNIRLFRNHPEACWQGRVHEQVSLQLERLKYEVILTDISIEHIGYADATILKRKNDRNLRLLRLEYAERPHDAMVLFHLGRLYLSLGLRAHALQHLQQCLKHASSCAVEVICKLYALLTNAYVGLGRTDEAIAIATEGLKFFPGDPELICLKSELLIQVRQLDAAERLLLQVVGRPLPQVYLIGVLKDLTCREARQMLARVYLSRRRYEEAEAQIQRCLAEFPDYTIGWATLGYVYVDKQDWKRLDFVIHQLSKCDNGLTFGLILRCVAAGKKGFKAEARQWIERAVEAAPHVYESRYLMAQLRSEMGDPVVDQLNAWREVLRVAPVCSDARAAVAILQRQTTSNLETAPLARAPAEIPWMTKIDVGSFVFST